MSICKSIKSLLESELLPFHTRMERDKNDDTVYTIESAGFIFKWVEGEKVIHIKRPESKKSGIEFTLATDPGRSRYLMGRMGECFLELHKTGIYGTHGSTGYSFAAVKGKPSQLTMILGQGSAAVTLDLTTFFGEGDYKQFIHALGTGFKEMSSTYKWFPATVTKLERPVGKPFFELELEVNFWGKTIKISDERLAEEDIEKHKLEPEGGAEVRLTKRIGKKISKENPLLMGEIR